jgi:hypothetical protein
MPEVFVAHLILPRESGVRHVRMEASFIGWSLTREQSSSVRSMLPQLPKEAPVRDEICHPLSKCYLISAELGLCRVWCLKVIELGCNWAVYFCLEEGCLVG